MSDMTQLIEDLQHGILATVDESRQLRTERDALREQLAEERNRWQVELSRLELAVNQTTIVMTERVEKAEAACAAMREAIDTVLRNWRYHDERETLRAALATDAGRGWMSPEKVREVRRYCDLARCEVQALRQGCQDDSAEDEQCMTAADYLDSLEALLPDDAGEKEGDGD